MKVPYGGVLYMSTLHRLRLFSKVVEKQSFSSAAEELFTSQPSISAQIKSFEKSLGLILIDRLQSQLQNKIVLTDAGKYIYYSVQRIISEWEKIETFSKSKDSSFKVIRILSNSPIGSYVLPDLISEFNNNEPLIKIDLEIEMNYKNFIKKLNSNSIDLAISPRDVLLDISSDNFNKSSTFKVPIILVTTGQDNLTNKAIPLELLNDLPLYLPSQSTVGGKELDSYLNSLCIFPTNATYVDHSETMKRMLCKNKKHFGIISEIAVREEVDSGIFNIIPTEPTLMAIDYVILCPMRNHLSRGPKIFLEFLTTTLSQNYLE